MAALLFSVLMPSYAVSSITYVLLSGPLAALPILVLWALSWPFAGFPGAWMGFGDVKVALGIGWLLPLPTALSIPLGLIAIFLAFILGALISVCVLLPLPYIAAACGIRPKGEHEGYTMKSEVPFGPFLIGSCVLVWFSVLYHVAIPFV
jgi:hypothetical protein